MELREANSRLWAGLFLSLVVACGYLGGAEGADCNGNGIDDAEEVDAGTVADCNRNGIPDRCEPERGVYFLNRELIDIARMAGLDVTIRSDTWSPVTRDFDGDGAPDLAGAFSVASGLGSDLDMLWVLFNDGRGRFERLETYRFWTDVGVFEVLSDDFDGDGSYDIVAVTDGGRLWNQLYYAHVPPPQSPGRGLPPIGRAYLFLNDGTGNFELRSVFYPGTLAMRGTAGDVDGDGLPDLVFVESWWPEQSLERPESLGTIAVLRNAGGGKFEEPRYFLSTWYPRDPILADLNEDGLLDIVSTHWIGAGPVISVLLNEGGVQFGEAAIYEAGPGPVAWRTGGPKQAAAGDLDGDGHLDVAVGLLDSASLAILWGDGTGRLSEPQYVYDPYMWDPSHVALADFDGDGDLDVIAGYGALFFFENLGERRIAQPRMYGVGGLWSRRFVVEDFDLDGRPDIASLPQLSWEVETARNYVQVVRNLGAWRLDVPRAYPLARGGDALAIDLAALADADGDGALDFLALARELTGEYHFVQLRNLGDGSFEVAQIEELSAYPVPSGERLSPTTRFADALIPHDIDGDGDLDVLAPVWSARRSRVITDAGMLAYLRNDAGHFVLEKVFRVGSPGSAFWDYDGDGYIDFVGGTKIFWGGEGLTFTPSPLDTDGPDYIGGALAADWDGDGLVDLGVRAGLFRDARLEIHRNLGGRRFERTEVVLDANTGDGIVNYMAKGDFDGDGDPDLAAMVYWDASTAPREDLVLQRYHWYQKGSAVVVLRNEGGRFERMWQRWIAWGKLRLTAGDLDGDGVDDLVLTSWMYQEYRGPLVVFLSKPGGGLREVRKYTSPVGPYVLGAVIGDLDRDGDADLAVGGPGGQGVLTVYLNHAPQPTGDVSARECGDAVLFTRGDVVGIGRISEVSVREILRWLFLGEGRVEECLDAADVDDDGAITVADAVLLVIRLYGTLWTLPPPAYCGADPTPDRLDCKQGPGCP